MMARSSVRPVGRLQICSFDYCLEPSQKMAVRITAGMGEDQRVSARLLSYQQFRGKEVRYTDLTLLAALGLKTPLLLFPNQENLPVLQKVSPLGVHDFAFSAPSVEEDHEQRIQIGLSVHANILLHVARCILQRDHSRVVGLQEANEAGKPVEHRAV